MRHPPRDTDRSADAKSDNEVQALAEAVLEAASVAGLGVTVSFDDGLAPRHIYVNEAAARILGSSVEALTGAEMLLDFAPEDRSRLLECAARWREGDATPRVAEMVVVQQDGARVAAEVAFSVVALSGEPAIITFLRDISERKAAQAADRALRRSEQGFRRLIEAAPDAVAVHRDDRLVYVNPAFVALYGRPFDQVIQRRVTEFVHPDDGQRLTEYHQRSLAGSTQPSAIEYRILDADGQVVNVETLSLPIEDSGGPALLDFTRDVTERKLLQTHLALRDRMAMLGMLAAGVAHEINNPLAYAALNVDAIVRELESSAPESVRLAMQPVIAAARDGLARVASIVRDLKGLSTPKSEERWPVDVKEVLESALNVAMHTIRGKARVDKRFGDVPMLRTDPTKLGQIFLNLVFNAVQSFEPESDEDVNDDDVNGDDVSGDDVSGDADSDNVIVLATSSPHPLEVVVTVSDNGPGISRDRLEHIFEPFFTTKNEGTGLGLAICQTLASSLNAKLGVESEVGRGTTFTVRLPV